MRAQRHASKKKIGIKKEQELEGVLERR